MKIETFQTIEEIFEFRRPMHTYQKMYGMKKTKRWCQRLGILPTVFFSFLVIILVGFFFRSMESNFLSQTNGLPLYTEIQYNQSITVGDKVRSLFGIETSYAAEPDVVVKDIAYRAQFLSQSVADPIEIEAGQSREVVVIFKNSGSATWKNNGPNFISAYTMEPRHRVSPFFNSSQIKMAEPLVTPGQSGSITFNLTAPSQTGEYLEKFYLASENHTWINKGYFYLKLKVVQPKIIEKVAEDITDKTVLEQTTEVVVSSTESQIVGKRVNISKKEIEAKGGERIKIVVIYKNTGLLPWQEYAIHADPIASLASGDNSLTFADEAWESTNLITKKETQVYENGVVRETFYIRTPIKIGEYLFTANFKSGDTVVGEPITINVHVTENAPLNYTPPKFVNEGFESSEVEKVPRLAEEPRIRVGLKVDKTAVQFRPIDDDYIIFDGEKQMGVLLEKKMANIQYDGVGTYNFSGGIRFYTKNIIRLVPKNDSHARYILLNIERPMAWVGPADFNEYRGKFEFVQGQVDKEMYVIVDTLLEDYVRGVAETGRGAELEYVKANIVAARTYAYLSKGKYPLFDVLGSTYDQLFLGAEVEQYLTDVPRAAEATRGMMVAYQDEIVTTPYFGNSNGYTKSWKSVWGGTDKPWLQSVKATYDLRDGRRQFGHGVGMSQHDANIRAKEEGLGYVDLLKYYYTGIEVGRIYN